MGASALIAVVDDEPLWLAALGRGLARAGFRALLLGDPATAADRIVDDGAAVVIVDRFMPGLDGVELARELRARLGADCPALVLVSGDVGDLEDASLFAHVAQKPVSLALLLEEVARLAAGAKRSGTHRKPGRRARADDDDDEGSQLG